MSEHKAVRAEELKVGDNFYVLPKGDLLSAMERVRKLEITEISKQAGSYLPLTSGQPDGRFHRYEIKAKELISPVKLCEHEIVYAAYESHVFIQNSSASESTPINKMNTRFSSIEALQDHIKESASNVVKKHQRHIEELELQIQSAKEEHENYQSQCVEVISSIPLLEKGLRG